MELEKLVEEINSLSNRKIIFRKLKKLSEVHEYGKNRDVPVYSDMPNVVLTRKVLESTLDYLNKDAAMDKIREEQNRRYDELKQKILTVLSEEELEEFIAANQPY